MNKDLKDKMALELRQYWDNKKLLEELEQHGSTRSIIFCQQRIIYVENVMKQLKPFEKQMFYFIFKDCYDWIYCEAQKNISKSTYYNIYNKCITLLAKEWGIM